VTDVVSVTLLRHGRSRADDEGVHEGRYDSPLTEAGRAQVRARAGNLARRGFTFDAIVASPLARAAESAAIVAEALGGAVELDPDWMEFNNGPLAGLSFAEAETRFPSSPLRSPYAAFWQSGESRWELYCRAVGALEKWYAAVDRPWWWRTAAFSTLRCAASPGRHPPATVRGWPLLLAMPAWPACSISPRKIAGSCWNFRRNPRLLINKTSRPKLRPARFV